VTALEPREAYRLWAPTYAEETAISHIDQEVAERLSPSPEGRRLLDVGCGIGRRLSASRAALGIGVDLSIEMLSAGAERAVAVADVRALPFLPEAFDLVWCRLVLGHLPDLAPAYTELARVCRMGGHVFVTDFHAEAAARGHTRSFRDRFGRKCVVEHHVHDRDRHSEMAAGAGLTLRAYQDGRIGASVRGFYDRAGRQAAFARDLGLPVVSAFLLERAS
jgi:malonyl-CoA O-methyltransferase